jgi:hypothetical protein
LLENQCWIGGYELGIAFPPDWVGSYYFDVWKELGNDAFEPGFVSNYEANFYLPKDSCLSCMIDTMIVEGDTATFIHRVPCRLFVATNGIPVPATTVRQSSPKFTGVISGRLRSMRISRAALQPGAAITPPPGWLLEPHRYRLPIGPRYCA